jgi:short-subunit dehydrogenase
MNKLVTIVGMGPGVSAAVARRFGREGFKVAAIARRADALKEQTDALAGVGVTAYAYTADASEPVSLAAALTRVAADHGDTGVLVYNAAAMRYKPLADLTAEELNADLRLSVGGALAAAQAVLPAMRRQGAGTLLFTGGGFAHEPMAAMASLGVGKAGIRNLAFSLFVELKDAGIHAATVTIGGLVKPGTAYDPDKIAEAYWTLHAQPKGSFERELVLIG